MGTKWRNIRSNMTTKIILFVILAVSMFNASYSVIHLLDEYDKKDMSFTCLVTDSVMDTPIISCEFTEILYLLSDKFIDKNLWDRDVLFEYDDKIDYYIEGYNGVILTNNESLNKDDYLSDMSCLIENSVTLEMESSEFSKILPVGIEIFDYNISAALNEIPDEQLEYYKRDYKSDQKVIPYPQVRIKNIYFKYKDNYTKQVQENFNNNKTFITTQMYKIAIYLFVALIEFILLSLSAGHRKDKIGITLIKLDKIYFEIYFVGALILGSLIVGIFLEFSDNWFIKKLFDNSVESFITIGIVTPVCILMYMTLMSIIRRVKAKKFLETTIVGIIINKIKYFLSIIWELMIKEDVPKTRVLFVMDIIYVAFSVISALIMVAFYKHGIFLIFPMILVIAVIFIKISTKIHYEIDNTVDERLENMLKSERTKTELITGVSHDLKTPITSIVAYIDLLKKEDLSDKIKEYVDIIDKKANNLIDMVKDLFDIAKTVSGDINIERDNIDINKLIKQTLADMQDRIEASEFIIKESYLDDELIICSDGKKLYRVIQNLIDNALKYSLKGSRIYIHTQKSVDVNNQKSDSYDSIIIKLTNTASYEMNFDTQDIKKRFVRADKSRTEDGSGLGLAISSTYINAMGGRFDIQVDGDQFKVIIEIPK